MEKAPAKEQQLNLHASAPAAPSVEMEISNLFFLSYQVC